MKGSLGAVGFGAELGESPFEPFGLKGLRQERFGYLPTRRLERLAALSQHRVVPLPDATHGPIFECRRVASHVTATRQPACPKPNKKYIEHDTEPE